MNKIKQNKKIITHTLIIASIILLAVISLQAGFAATTTTIDNTTAGGISGALSSSSPGDTIELEEGTYTGNNNTNMTINKNITITGKIKDKVILDAQGLRKIFIINNDLNVTFINLTFINGYSENSGGAVDGGYRSNISMDFLNCTFINNTASNGIGGAIFNFGYNLTITNCYFIGNIASQFGGAVYNGGNNMTIIKSNFTDNHALSHNGGAIRATGNNNNISECNFINNSAVCAGAISMVLGNNLTIDKCNFTNNSALDASAIEIGYGNQGTVIGCIISDNLGVSTIIIVNGDNFTISDNTINDNINNGIFIRNCSNVTITGNEIVGNGGYGVSNGGDATISDNVIKDNNGEGINNVENGTAVITDNEIIGNGGSGINNDGDATINGNVINDNTGDGIKNGGTGTADIVGNEVVGNGGYGVSNDGDTTISDNVINDNTAGGIKNGETGTADITDNEIVGNGGSGVSNDGDATISDNVIKDNNGDGINNGENGNATVENNNISGNSGNDIVNNGDLSGSGNVNNVQSNLAINASVSGNKITIRVKATTKNGNTIAGRTISFYVNGKLIGSTLTNSEGIAEFIYTASSSGTYNILAKMDEFNETDTNVSILRVYSAATISKIVNILEKGTVITVSAPTIKEGKKTNIKVTLKDINGNILKNKKISLTIKGKTYTATTNNNGIAVFNIAGLKGGKHTITAKFTGDNNYKSSKISKVQKVSPKTNLGIVSIKKLSFRKKVSTYRVTIANKGSLKSKSTVLALFHMRNGVKIKTKYIKIKSIAPGKKISIIVSYFPDRANHRYCIAHFQIDPKNKNKEIILANNKKSISLKH